MTTIEEVVKTWDDAHRNYPNAQTKLMRGKNVQPGGKIKYGSIFDRLNKWAIIKLLDASQYTQWDEQICYVFDFKAGKPEINFQKRSGYPCDTEKLYEFLGTNFGGKEINGKNLTLARGRNPDNLILKINFDINSSTKEICDCMEGFIKLTQKKICDFLEGKDKEKFSTKSEEKLSMKSEEKLSMKSEEKLSTESEEKLSTENDGIPSKIMDKYNINEDENKELYGKCKEIYDQTIEILKNLESENPDKLKVSHYTKKSIAQKLFTTSNDKLGEFRLYYIHGMNDPSEGKTLLSFLGIKNEDLKLPEYLPFVACFSLEVNSLNQFRLYGNEDNKEANGVSIVFKPDFFNESRKLYCCVYIDQDKGIKSISFSKTKEETEKVEKLFKGLRDKIKELLDIQELLNIDKHELAKDLLIKIRYLVKDYAFMEERECRIIDMIDEGIKIDGERLYVEIGKIKDYISEIYFAPLAEGMEAFEIETGIKCIRSRHPYKSKVVEEKRSPKCEQPS